MKDVLLVGLGGGVGAIARFKLGGWVLHHTPDWTFPAGTFSVNVLGCVVAGALWGLAEKHGLFAPETRLLLFTGVLGGFTTFSAFGLETVNLARRGEAAMAAGYVASSVLIGCTALWLVILAIPRGTPP